MSSSLASALQVLILCADGPRYLVSLPSAALMYSARVTVTPHRDVPMLKYNNPGKTLPSHSA